jgi:hypothetical protein
MIFPSTIKTRTKAFPDDSTVDVGLFQAGSNDHIVVGHEQTAMYFAKIFASWETHPHAERGFKMQQSCMIHTRVQRLNSEEPMHTYRDIDGRYKEDVHKEVNIETELQQLKNI